MIVQTESTKIYTPTEYLTLEVSSEIRHEYLNGFMIPMMGGTPNHNDIASNLVGILKMALKKRPYRVFILDQRLWIPAVNHYTYPDVMVVPKPVELQPGRADIITNSCFIAVVLSNSTQAYDRGDKFTAHGTIPTFQEYQLIDQYQIYVEHRVKMDGDQWLIFAYQNPGDTLKLNSIDVEVTVGDLYENVDGIYSNMM